MTAAKERDTLHRISSQNSRSAALKVSFTKSDCRFDLSGLM